MKIRIVNGLMEQNTYIISDDDLNTVIIDPGANIDSINKVLNENNLSLKLIMLTHGHYDHVVSAEALKELYNVNIGCSFFETEILENKFYNFSLNLGITIEFTPDVTYADNEIIKCGSLEFMAIETPGHTPGGMCYKIDNVIFTGDSIFYGDIGRTDFYKGSEKTLLNNIITKVLIYPNETKLYSGHGRSTTVEFEKRTHNIHI